MQQISIQNRQSNINNGTVSLHLKTSVIVQSTILKLLNHKPSFIA